MFVCFSRRSTATAAVFPALRADRLCSMSWQRLTTTGDAPPALCGAIFELVDDGHAVLHGGQVGLGSQG